MGGYRSGFGGQTKAKPQKIKKTRSWAIPRTRLMARVPSQYLCQCLPFNSAHFLRDFAICLHLAELCKARMPSLGHDWWMAVYGFFFSNTYIRVWEYWGVLPDHERSSMSLWFILFSGTSLSTWARSDIHNMIKLLEEITIHLCPSISSVFSQHASQGVLWTVLWCYPKAVWCQH